MIERLFEGCCYITVEMPLPESNQQTVDMRLMKNIFKVWGWLLCCLRQTVFVKDDNGGFYTFKSDLKKYVLEAGKLKNVTRDDIDLGNGAELDLQTIVQEAISAANRRQESTNFRERHIEMMSS